LARFTRRRALVAAVAAILIFASVTSLYLKGIPAGGKPFANTNTPASCADPLAGRSMVKVQLSAPTMFGGVTEFNLPSPLMNPAAPVVAPDGSVWFYEQTVPGLAHFYPDNRTLVEYATPGDYYPPKSYGAICSQKSSSWGVALWAGKVWASDMAGNQLVALDPSTGQYSSVKLPTADSAPYTLTLGPNGSLWFTELFSGKIGELKPDGSLSEFTVPEVTPGHSAEPAQIVFANSTRGYYSAIGGGGVGAGGVFSFDPSHFSPTLVGGRLLTAPTSLTLADGALWVALHGSSSVGAYNFSTGSWSYFPTNPVSYIPTTLPYFVEASGTSIWLNEHYGNRMAVIDPVNRTLVEYNEAKSPVNASTIGNAVTFGYGGGRAWFAESSGNVLGYVDSSYDPGFSTSISGSSAVVTPRGASANMTLLVHDTSHVGPLNLSVADSEGFSSTPSNITYSFSTLHASPSNVPTTTISVPRGGEAAVQVTITALQSLKPGNYTALFTATDGTTYESCFATIVVPP
jgi:streptogramin lyase